MGTIEKTTRKMHSIETKRKIYESAAQLFRQYGFEVVSVDRIVKNAGVSKGSFYVHFDSKDTLIAALTAEYVNKLDMDYQFFLDTLATDAKASDILIAFVGKIADVITNTVGHDVMKIIYAVQLTKTVDMDAVMGYNRELYRMFSQVIERGMQQEEFRTDLSADGVAKHFILAFRGLTYEWCIRHPDFDLKSQSLVHFELLISGLKK